MNTINLVVYDATVRQVYVYRGYQVKGYSLTEASLDRLVQAVWRKVWDGKGTVYPSVLGWSYAEREA